MNKVIGVVSLIVVFLLSGFVTFFFFHLLRGGLHQYQEWRIEENEKERVAMAENAIPELERQCYREGYEILQMFKISEYGKYSLAEEFRYETSAFFDSPEYPVLGIMTPIAKKHKYAGAVLAFRGEEGVIIVRQDGEDYEYPLPDSKGFLVAWADFRDILARAP